MTARGTNAPRHLRVATRRWWESVVTEFELEPHHIRLLTLAGEAWDRTQQAREAVSEHGLTYTDRFGTPRWRALGHVAVQYNPPKRLGELREVRN